MNQDRIRTVKAGGIVLMPIKDIIIHQIMDGNILMDNGIFLIMRDMHLKAHGILIQIMDINII